MGKMTFVVGALCIVLAVVVFVFAEGFRKYYGAAFLAVIGTTTLVNALRR